MIGMTRFAVLLTIFLAASASAQEAADSAIAARAAQKLSRAAALLEAAEEARNRVRALTETIRAYEDGLGAMREGLRRATIREQVLARDLAAREDEVARLLGVLESIGKAPAPIMLLHPAGPLGAARSGMILSEVTPALNERARDLRNRLQEVKAIRKLQESEAEQLRNGLEGAQKARAELSQAIADRKDLPRRFIEDPVQTALLVASADTL